MTRSDAIGSRLSLMLSLGMLGGTLLILSALFFTPGKFILIPYAALVAATAIVLRASRFDSYGDRFLVGFGTFMLATIALYVFLLVWTGQIGSLEISGHVWRLGIMALIGLVLNTALARVSEPA